jgi:hypothetical protein
MNIVLAWEDKTAYLLILATRVILRKNDEFSEFGSKSSYSTPSGSRRLLIVAGKGCWGSRGLDARSNGLFATHTPHTVHRVQTRFQNESIKTTPQCKGTRWMK